MEIANHGQDQQVGSCKKNNKQMNIYKLIFLCHDCDDHLRDC